jgi:hypothetical protein
MRVGEGRRVGEIRIGEGRTSVWPSWPAAGDGDAHVSGRGVASKKGGASWRGASGMGAARRGGDDSGGREATTTTKTIWGKTTKCGSGRRRGLYKTQPFVTGRETTRDKRVFRAGSLYRRIFSLYS